MAACTFFGHRDCPPTVLPKLRAILEELIDSKTIDRFYVGNQGFFDGYVRSVLHELKGQYPHINYFVVLAYMPNDKMLDLANDIETILPEGIERVPRRYAISYRNRWMVQQSDYVISYLTRSFGGAAQFVKLAEKKNKICINLAVQAK